MTHTSRKKNGKKNTQNGLCLNSNKKKLMVLFLYFWSSMCIGNDATTKTNSILLQILRCCVVCDYYNARLR